MTAVESVLLHDLVVGERSATICGRERNPTGIESAIRARFVRDSFHNLSTGLPQGFPVIVGGAVAPRWATLGSAWKMRAAKGRDQRRSGPIPGQSTAGRLAGAPSWPARDASASTSTAVKFGAIAAIARPATRACGSRWALARRLPDLWEACIFRAARCNARLRARLEPVGRSPPRRAIRDPRELHCACRSVTESIPS